MKLPLTAQDQITIVVLVLSGSIIFRVGGWECINWNWARRCQPGGKKKKKKRVKKGWVGRLAIILTGNLNLIPISTLPNSVGVTGFLQVNRVYPP